jgi:hypothetical protein
MRGSRRFALAVALGAAWLRAALVLVTAVACGRTELEVPSDDDALPATGGTAPNPGSGGRKAAGGDAGFVGVGGTATGGSAGSAGSNLTHPEGGGSGAGAANQDACIIFVLPFEGDDANDGTSWDRAVHSLTRALALAHSNCEVWLASGTYTPTPESSRLATFTVPAGVTIRGGFAGTEQSSAERTFAELLPLLSGDIGDQGQLDDVYHVVTTLGAATLDHIYIAHGHAPADAGGGAVVAAGALTLDTCNVYKSSSDGDAGGILAHGALSVKSSTFSALVASRNGGAIAVDGMGPLTFDESVFDENAASDGGALYVAQGRATLEVTNSTFTRNTATGVGAPTGNGGAISFQGATVALGSSTFLENGALAGLGGALYATGNANAVNDVAARNTAINGAAFAQAGTGTLELVNVTVAENEAGSRAAVDVEDGASIRIANSVLWGDIPAEIIVKSAALSSEGSTSKNLFASNMSGTYPNLALFDPRFVDASDENYRLLSSSACIDHADDSRAPATDLLGHPRVGKADMGAYEYGN